MRKQRANTHGNRKPSRWQSSEQWREIGRAAIRGWNAKRPFLPKCGARRKRDGEPCQQLALANGRCFVHGGRTPKGEHWHKPRWPNGDSPDVEKKLQRKLRDHQRAAKKRAARMAQMTPEERARYEKWHSTRQPGSAAERARRRQERGQAAEMRKRLGKPAERPVSEEAAALRKRIEELEAKLAAASDDLGVFG